MGQAKQELSEIINQSKSPTGEVHDTQGLTEAQRKLPPEELAKMRYIPFVVDINVRLLHDT